MQNPELLGVQIFRNMRRQLSEGFPVISKQRKINPEVADFLASQPPSCPIVIATTNSAAGDGMEFRLREAQWKTYRVHPCGDLKWITGQWFRTLRNAIVGSARPR